MSVEIERFISSRRTERFPESAFEKAGVENRNPPEAVLTEDNPINFGPFEVSKSESRIEENSFPKVSIIVLHYGRKESGEKNIKDTEECLTSLENLDYPNCELIIVDNGSTDGFFSRYQEGFVDRFPRLPQVTLIKSEVNLGFTGGNNLAMEYALERETDYLFLLNNDTVVDGDLVSALVTRAEELPEEVGILGPKMYYYRNGEKTDIFQTVGGRFARQGIGAGEKDRGQYERAMEVDFVGGLAILIKAEVVGKTGGFDPRFFLWGEEIDLCLRAKNAGYRSFYIPEGRVWHKVSQSIGGRYSPLNCYFSSRNMILLMKKHSGLPRCLFAVRTLLANSKTIFGIIANRNFEAFRAWIKGCYDGIVGNYSEVKPKEVMIRSF